MTDLPHIGLVISGGTLTALAEDPYEICDYGQAGSYTVPEVMRQFGHLDQRFRVTEVPFDPVPSFDMGFTKWRDIYTSCRVTLAQNPDIEGFVLTHGTGALAETAFFLSLVWDLGVPLVVTGAQRPASAQGSDGPMNLFHALKAAADPRISGSGVVVAINAELHDPRDVSKFDNAALDSFRSPWRGSLGRFTGNTLDLFRPIVSHLIPTASEAWQKLSDLPRVDILFCHSDGDTTALEAFFAAGAQGIVIAGFAPGYATSVQAQALEHWSKTKGGIVIAASHASGRVPENSRNHSHGFMSAASLSPAKARILLQLCVSQQKSSKEISELFDRVSAG